MDYNRRSEMPQSVSKKSEYRKSPLELIRTGINFYFMHSTVGLSIIIGVAGGAAVAKYEVYNHDRIADIA